jgi:release factor glutamine methyltransferase
VIDFEPHLALFVTDSDPLAYYNAILRIAENALLPAGRIYFEINERMGNSMSSLLKSYNYSDIQVVADLSNKDRIVKGIKYVG